MNYWYACLRISFNVEVCHNIIVEHFEGFWKCPQSFGLGSGTRGGGGGVCRSLKPLQVFGCWPSGAVAAVTSSSAGSSCRGLSSSFGGLSLNPLSGVGLDAGDEIVGRIIPFEAGEQVRCCLLIGNCHLPFPFLQQWGFTVSLNPLIQVRSLPTSNTPKMINQIPTTITET